MERIHQNTMFAFLRGNKPVDVRFWKKNGDAVQIHALPLKEHRERGTWSFKCLPSDVVRTVRTVSIFGIDDYEVFL